MINKIFDKVFKKINFETLLSQFLIKYQERYPNLLAHNKPQ